MVVSTVLPGLRSLLILVSLALVVVLLRRVPATRAERFAARLGSAWFPIVAGIFAALLVAWQWGGLRAPAVVHDEAAYLLQAELFATGRWAAPPPPEFAAFTQPAVLVTPVLAPKMPPGHALAMIPGVLLHLPGLVPVLMIGGTAMLLVALVRRATGPGTALLALAFWTTQAGQARWRASYYSETTTALLWLAGWWALWRWRETGRSSWLVALAVATGWIAITRPLSAVVFALPVAWVVLRDVARHRRWFALTIAMAAGIAVLSLLPMQNAATLGNWRESPLARYTAQYLPFDRVGFGLDATPPRLTLPAGLDGANTGFIERHREHVPSALPRILGDRLAIWASSNFGAWRHWLAPLALLGLLVAGPPLRFAAITGALLYVAYLGYAHEPYWSLYYVEAATVWPALVAAGAAFVIAAGAGRARTELAQVTVALLVMAWASPEWSRSRATLCDGQAPFRRFDAAVTALPGDRLLVFVRYAPNHNPHVALHRNVADPADARVVTALDLGAASRAAVRAAFPTRAAWIWDEAADRFLPETP